MSAPSDAPRLSGRAEPLGKAGPFNSTMPAPPPPRRVRRAVAIEGAAHGASDEALGQPAAAFFDAMPWQGPSPDPDVLDAVTFLAWL